MLVEFARFFSDVTGQALLPYQRSHAADPFRSTLLSVPTGLGKTYAAVVPWLYGVAGGDPRCPTRMFVVLPRQNLTEQTYQVVKRLVAAAQLNDSVCVIELMGGSADNEVKLGPDQRAVIVCTQDMYLSRALNRGYARRPPHWPIDFGLFNNDSLVVFDEVQLMSDGLATSTQLAAFRERFGRFGSTPSVWMSATLRPEWLDTIDFRDTRRDLRKITLGDEDLKEEFVRTRIHAEKRIAAAPESCRTPNGCAEFALSQHQPDTRTLVIANTVRRATEIFESLRGRANAILLHSRFRPPERARKVQEMMGSAVGGQIVVATQVLEAGIDLTSRCLITDCAPWSSLVQRFGRVNRDGQASGAEIWWVNQPLSSKSNPGKENLFAPYPAEEVLPAIDKLKGLTSAAPADLPAEEGPAPWQHVLRRADLLDLFDTTPDLSGNEIDISRFIRSGEEKDCYLAWRDWPTEDETTLRHQPEVRPEELCPAPIHELRAFGKKHRLFAWDFVSGGWGRADPDRFFPGLLVVAHAKEGGYSPETGWRPESKARVEPFAASVDEPASDESDRKSFLSYRQTLADHTRRVVEETEALVERLQRPGISEYRDVLLNAAWKHDWGKAHDVMQARFKIDEVGAELLAKQSRDKSAPRYGRRHFRHELASALAMLASGDGDFLACYLTAAHHGRVRMVIRSMPDEGERRIRGIEGGDELPAFALAPGLNMPLVKLSLDPARMGRGANGEKSWTERAVALRDELGPFRLAYLEAVLRTADTRASESPWERVNLSCR